MRKMTPKQRMHNIHESASGGGENETRHIFTKEDARARLKVRKHRCSSRGVFRRG